MTASSTWHSFHRDRRERIARVHFAAIAAGDILTAAELAEAFGVSTKTVRRAIAEHRQGEEVTRALAEYAHCKRCGGEHPASAAQCEAVWP